MIGSDSLRVPKLASGERRRSIIFAYINGGLWGIGNGLAGTTLVVYLATSYGATGVAISWLLAAPALVGVLRLFSPLWMDRVGDRRKFCSRMFLASALVLLGLPWMSAPEVLPRATPSIVALTTCWATYHLLEHFAVVALWSWFGDLIPRPIRGRFVGRRLSWINGGKILGIVVSAISMGLWKNYGEPEQLWLGFATLATIGASVMLLAIWPLTKMTDPPSPSGIGTRLPRQRLGELLAPFADASFRRLLYYGFWFSFANGISDTAVRVYQITVLQITFTEKRILDSSSRGIQSLLMPWAGLLADRHGNVPLLVVSQGLVAMALLFLLIASAAAKWWILGTYFLWIAYAGTNVAMPNLMLHLGPRTCYASYAAVWFAWKELIYAMSTLAGGLLFDWASLHFEPRTWGGWQIDHFFAIFLLGWVLRMLGALWAARIQE